MEKMHEEAKKKGLIFLNECGLDPGIDIMSTMKVKDEAEGQGFKIVGYESYCGGIPVAE
jgi:saccharopine dehydrogenase-like NADP-dependent oxidoreductase